MLQTLRFGVVVCLCGECIEDPVAAGVIEESVSSGVTGSFW